MTPRFILLHNGTEFKNKQFDKVACELGIERLFTAPYHLQSNGELEVFHNFFKPALKKLCEHDPDNWDNYINLLLGVCRQMHNAGTGESPFSYMVWTATQYCIICYDQ